MRSLLLGLALLAGCNRLPQETPEWRAKHCVKQGRPRHEVVTEHEPDTFVMFGDVPVIFSGSPYNRNVVCQLYACDGGYVFETCL